MIILILDFCFMVLDKNLLISNCVHVGVRTSHSWIVQLLSRWQLVVGAQFGRTCYRVPWVYLSFCILYLYFVFVFLLFCWIVQLLSRWQLVQLVEPNLARLATAYHVAGQFWQQHVLTSLRRICEHMLQKPRAGPLIKGGSIN